MAKKKKKSRSKSKKSKSTKKKIMKKAEEFSRNDFMTYGLAIFILIAGALFVLPSYESKETYLNIEDAYFTEEGDLAVEISHSAPWTGSCYLTVDARPEGAPMGEKETPSWDENHLIIASHDGSTWHIEKWINIEVLSQREAEKTYRYKLSKTPQTVDIYVTLNCDDEKLHETKTTI